MELCKTPYYDSLWPYDAGAFRLYVELAWPYGALSRSFDVLYATSFRPYDLCELDFLGFYDLLLYCLVHALCDMPYDGFF